jgi:hypothetical protein
VAQIKAMNNLTANLQYHKDNCFTALIERSKACNGFMEARAVGRQFADRGSAQSLGVGV